MLPPLCGRYDKMIQFGDLLVYIIAFFGFFTSFYFITTLIKHRDEVYPARLKKEPKVSIAIPVYNGAESIRVTADSLLDLNYPRERLELFIVDDGSTDDTLQVAREYEKKGFTIISKEHEGKAEALNAALDSATGEFFGALDADSYADPEALNLLLPYFERKEVMAVTPSLRISEPSTLLQRVQQIEYIIGIFLRKIFAFLGSIHVTPGPLTMYRKEFFDTYGGYDPQNLTEDIEVALRIQRHDYVIENSVIADVYTTGPPTFKNLLNQRLRWYKGFFDNVLRYKDLFSVKHGNLGVFILPASFISVFLVLIMLGYMTYRMTDSSIIFIQNLIAVNFDIFSLFNFKWDTFLLNVDSAVVLSIFLFALSIATIILAKRVSMERAKIKFSYLGYIIFYWFLFGFWWLVAFYYKLVGKKIVWGGKAL